MILNSTRKKLKREPATRLLSEDIPRNWRGLHVSFSHLYELVREARNDALHQGAFAGRLTRHAIELSLVLEGGLRRSMDKPTVDDYMARNPVCAELWRPISFLRQQMLANSFSFLPVGNGVEWCLVSDLEIATYLGTDVPQRRRRLTDTLREAKLSLQPTLPCLLGTPLDGALAMLSNDRRALLVCRKEENNRQNLVGIVTLFDLLSSEPFLALP